MNLFYFIFFLVLFDQTFSINWLGQYAYNCDFNGNDIEFKVVSNLEKCWMDCLTNQNCTHYVYSLSDRFCYQKNKNGISHEIATELNGHICGIVDKTMVCLEMMDFSPVPLSCGLYYECVLGNYSFVNCLDGRLFDPFTKQCSNYSACYHGCRNSTDKVGILLQTNQYYDCQTNLINYCEEGKSFDLKEKKCLGPVLKHIFECKNSENLPNALLAERIVFDEQFCLNWCIRIFYCKIVQYENNICRIFGDANENTPSKKYKNVYIPRDFSLE